ncbi:MAG: Bax inhibitor-1/YccA family protein [Pseudomonadota bacterium]
MAEYGRRQAGPVTAGTRTAADMDEGLRSFMLGVYNYMGLGIAVCAISALAVMTYLPLLQFMAGIGKWVAFAGVLGLGWFGPRLMMGSNAVTAQITYWGYCALWGLLVAPMVYVYLAGGNSGMVVQAFAITACMFGAMSLFGYTTQRDLTGMGQFLMMAAFGLLIAMLAYVGLTFFGVIEASSTFSLIFSCLIVLVFAGITAWETQEIKQMYMETDDARTGGGKALLGAMMLFGSFITLFIHILNILGIMGGDE